MTASGKTKSNGKKEVWTVLGLIQRTTEYLGEKGIDTARLDTELLLAFALETDRTHLYMNFDQPLNEDELSRFRALVKRRALHEPLQYITGQQEFWSMNFKVSPAVLIPRPETELLVEEGAKEIKKTFPGVKNLKILDLGTGSGALALTLAKEIEGSHVTGVDLSAEAILLARENAEVNGLASAITLFEGDLFAPVKGKQFHLIVSNPPYIPHADLEGLQPEVSEFEPLAALDGGADGLDFYRRIIPESITYLHPGGWLMVEHGEGQSESVSSLYEETERFDPVESIKDLAGIRRIVKGKCK